MRSDTFKIQSYDGRYWSAATATIDGINTMKLLSSSSESFQITPDESGWFVYLKCVETNSYLNWQYVDNHVALIVDGSAPEDRKVDSQASPNVPPPYLATFRQWNNGALVVFQTSSGMFLASTSDNSGMYYIDGTRDVTPACIFKLKEV